MNLNELSELCERILPDESPWLMPLLKCWAEEDIGGDLSRILSGCGVTVPDFAETATSFLCDGPHRSDQVLLARCLTSSIGAPQASDLLRFVLTDRSHRLTRALVQQGLERDVALSHLQPGPERQPEAVLTMPSSLLSPGAAELLKYGRDLTSMAERGTFDDYYDRREDSDRLARVLIHRNRGNPVLTGQAGCGKTALVETLARRLSRADVPPQLVGKRILELSMSKIVAGTRYRGDFEERMETVIQAARTCEKTILFIDEAHLMWGAGRAEGSPIDVGNLLKPALARGEIRIIAATTSEEYHRYVMRDEALARRFQEVPLPPPDEELTLRMVETQARVLAEYHGVDVPPEAVRESIDLANRHLPNRHQPDKSISLLDHACAMTVAEGTCVLTANDILAALAETTGRDVGTLTNPRRAKLRDLPDSLKKRVIGQDQAVDRVCSVLAYRRQDLGDSTRNLGTFLFLGDTGVGKSYLGEVLAEEYYGDKDHLIVLDMAEYSGAGGGAKLIGAPSGYSGAERRSTLVQFLHRQQSGVIILDEIEKAAGEVQLILLGLLERGRFRSGLGELLDTRTSIVILTSNAVTHQGVHAGGIGFHGGSTREIPVRTKDPAELLVGSFPREFVSRMDEIVVFNPLREGEVRRIVLLRLDEAVGRLNARGVSLEFDRDRLARHLARELERNAMGARGIARVLERLLLQPLAGLLLASAPEAPSHVLLGDAFYETGHVELTNGTGG